MRNREGALPSRGGEPLMQAEALEALLKGCRDLGLHTVVDTCGFAKRKYFERITEYTDLFLYDLKNIDPVLHKENTGVDNALILSNADYLLKQGARLIFRIPVIPGINTTKDELKRLISFIDERKDGLEEVHLLPYHRIAANKYATLKLKQHLADVKEPDPAIIKELAEQFGRCGLKVSIGG